MRMKEIQMEIDSLRERERERGGERQRERDRQTDRQTETEREGERERERKQQPNNFRMIGRASLFPGKLTDRLAIMQSKVDSRIVKLLNSRNGRRHNRLN